MCFLNIIALFCVPGFIKDRVRQNISTSGFEASETHVFEKRISGFGAAYGCAEIIDNSNIPWYGLLILLSLKRVQTMMIRRGADVSVIQEIISSEVTVVPLSSVTWLIVPLLRPYVMPENVAVQKKRFVSLSPLPPLPTPFSSLFSFSAVITSPFFQFVGS